MLLSDTAPDAQKHDVISSPTDTFGVISSGAVSAAQTHETDRTPRPTSPHRTWQPATLQSRSAPTKSRSGIVSSQLSALSTMEQCPEIFEVSHAEAKPFSHSASNADCRKLCTGQWKKGPRPGRPLQSPVILDSAVLPPGAAGPLHPSATVQKKTSSSRSTAQHRAAAAPTGTVRCRDDGFCWMLDCAADSPMA